VPNAGNNINTPPVAFNPHVPGVPGAGGAEVQNFPHGGNPTNNPNYNPQTSDDWSITGLMMSGFGLVLALAVVCMVGKNNRRAVASGKMGQKRRNRAYSSHDKLNIDRRK